MVLAGSDGSDLPAASPKGRRTLKSENLVRLIFEMVRQSADSWPFNRLDKCMISHLESLTF